MRSGLLGVIWWLGGRGGDVSTYLCLHRGAIYSIMHVAPPRLYFSSFHHVVLRFFCLAIYDMIYPKR